RFRTTEPAGMVEDRMTEKPSWPDRSGVTRSTVQRRTSGPGVASGGSPAVQGPAAVGAQADAVSAGLPSASAVTVTERLGVTYAAPAGRVSRKVRFQIVPVPALLHDTAYVTTVPAHTGPAVETFLWTTGTPAMTVTVTGLLVTVGCQIVAE